MILKEALKELTHRAHLTYSDLAEKCGAKSASFISKPLERNNIQVATLLKMCDICGYDLCLVNRDRDKLEYPIVIESMERVMEVERIKAERSE